MPQGMQTDALVDPGPLRRPMDGAVELPCGEGLPRNKARKQPSLGPRDTPPLPQEIEQML